MGKHKKRYENDSSTYDSPAEGLDEYIRVSRPSLLVVIISLLITLVAVIVWGFAGTLPVTETVKGAVVDSAVYAEIYPEKEKYMAGKDIDGIMVFCFIDASRYNGQAVSDFAEEALMKMPDQKTFKGKIETRGIAPVSREDARTFLFNHEWVLEQCVKQDYSWWLAIRPEDDLSSYNFTLAEVTFVTEEIAPIRFLMK